MERHEILDAMSELKLYGIRSACVDVIPSCDETYHTEVG